MRLTTFIFILTIPMFAQAAEVSVTASKEHPASSAPPAGHVDSHESVAQGPDAKQAWTQLMEGNQRFVNDVMSKTHKDAARRTAVANGQHPIAIVLSCADSRVPVEQVFDVGVGDIFVVRVAGNVVDDVVLGSIEYAATHLHVPLVVVLGHERCGAVSAAISGNPAPAHVLAIVDRIQANLAGSAPGTGNATDQAVCINAKASASQIANSSPILRDLVASGSLTVVTARYDLDDGVVTQLP